MSTSLDKKEAFKFMFMKLKKDEVSVMYQITNLSEYGWWYFKLDTDDYSLFSYEQEVLLKNGSCFDIENILEEIDEDRGLKYFLISLKSFDFT